MTNPARRLGLRVVNVHFGTFDYSFDCVVGARKAAIKYAKWKFEDPTFAYDISGWRGACFHRADYVPVVWIPRRPRTPREYATLAHEIMHVVRLMLVDWAEMPLTNDTDEAFCHALGHGMNAVLEGLRK